MEKSIKKLTDIPEDRIKPGSNLVFFDLNSEGMKRTKFKDTISFPHLTDFFCEEKNLCKLWNNGWLEQGGQLESNRYVFRRPFKSDTYTLILRNGTNDTNTIPHITKKTKTGFEVSSNKFPIYWYAFGVGV